MHDHAERHTFICTRKKAAGGYSKDTQCVISIRPGGDKNQNELLLQLQHKLKLCGIYLGVLMMDAGRNTHFDNSLF